MRGQRPSEVVVNAGPQVDANTQADAGLEVDVASQTDAGPQVDAGLQAGAGSEAADGYQAEPYPKRKLVQKISRFGGCKGIKLFEDNPLTFEDVEMDDSHTKVASREVANRQLYTTQSLKVWEHDCRVNLTRETERIELHPDDFKPYGLYEVPNKTLAAGHQGRRKVLRRIHDFKRMVGDMRCRTAVATSLIWAVYASGTVSDQIRRNSVHRYSC